MNPNDTQPDPNMPPEDDQEQMLVQFLQELDDRITALEEKVMGEETKEGDTPTTP